jgi:hypothetical protein
MASLPDYRAGPGRDFSGLGNQQSAVWRTE